MLASNAPLTKEIGTQLGFSALPQASCSTSGSLPNGSFDLSAGKPPAQRLCPRRQRPAAADKSQRISILPTTPQISKTLLPK
jgi:hypothetical protein